MGLSKGDAAVGCRGRKVAALYGDERRCKPRALKRLHGDPCVLARIVHLHVRQPHLHAERRALVRGTVLTHAARHFSVLEYSAGGPIAVARG